MAELNPDIPYAPEFGAFILDPTRANSTMSYTLDSKASKLDFSREITNYRTFLNLETMEGFYSGYQAKDISLMQNRFSFSNWDQVELFHEYLDEMVEKFLQQNTTYEIIPLSSLMNKNMQNTLGYLKTTLPL